MSKVDFVAAVLRQCGSLKTLKLALNGTKRFFANNSDSNCGEDINLQHLTTLSFKTTNKTTEILDFVKRLHIPSVTHMDMQVSNLEGKPTGPSAEEISRALLQTCGDNLQYLGLYSPLFLSSSDSLVELLRLTPYLKHLKVFSFSLSHNSWKSSLQRRTPCEQTIINDDLLHALSYNGNDDSHIICPQLKSLEWDALLVTRITERGLKAFLKARANYGDQRIAALQNLRVFVNEFKQKGEPDEDKVSLPGKNSAVAFRKMKKISHSPMLGVTSRKEQSVLQDIYTEL
ncbi:hypothetical protein BDQ17DRAFT_1347209 [Cyathus striatus]|nr:hypothetical protein BDQ17DRAFT_1347209 [Cyathus striatus]